MQYTCAHNWGRAFCTSCCIGIDGSASHTHTLQHTQTLHEHVTTPARVAQSQSTSPCSRTCTCMCLYIRICMYKVPAARRHMRHAMCTFGYMYPRTHTYRAHLAPRPSAHTFVTPPPTSPRVFFQVQPFVSTVLGVLEAAGAARAAHVQDGACAPASHPAVCYCCYRDRAKVVSVCYFCCLCLLLVLSL